MSLWYTPYSLTQLARGYRNGVQRRPIITSTLQSGPVGGETSMEKIMGLQILSERTVFPLEQKQVFKKDNFVLNREEVVLYEAHRNRTAKGRRVQVQRCKEVGTKADMKARCRVPSPNSTARVECLCGGISINHLIQPSIRSILVLVFIQLLSAREALRNRTYWKKKLLFLTILFQLQRSQDYSTCPRVTTITLLGSILLSSIQKKVLVLAKEKL